MLLMRTRLLIATFWVGTLWAVGYVVAPTLFSTIADRALAGTIAGSLFRVVAWLSVFCAMALIALLFQTARQGAAQPSKFLFGVVAAMLLCSLVGYFGLQPYMTDLRAMLHESAAVSDAIASDARKQFGMLHGIASAIYLVQSLLGVALILKIRE
jgi:hypothetical protein